MRAHPEWLLMADQGIPATVIARLNDVDPAYVRNYVRVRGQALRGGPAPVRQLLHDRLRPRPAHRPDPDRRWRARLQELEAFLAGHQRRPLSPRNETDRGPGSEWALAHWLTTQRSEHRTGRLPLHRARGWTGCCRRGGWTTGPSRTRPAGGSAWPGCCASSRTMGVCPNAPGPRATGRTAWRSGSASSRPPTVPGPWNRNGPGGWTARHRGGANPPMRPDARTGRACNPPESVTDRRCHSRSL
jgi:hypothetical protein